MSLVTPALSATDRTELLLARSRTALTLTPPIGDPAYARYCHELARSLTTAWPAVRSANARDIERAERRGLPPTLVNRLRVTDAHLRSMVRLTEQVSAELATVSASGPRIPAGDWGTLRQIPKPLGVLLMVYEARPTVTVDGALLPVVVGNSVLLRGGKECGATDAALAEAVQSALAAAGLPRDLVTVVDDPDRSVMKALLKRPDAVDVLVPRGSPSLIEYCRTASSIPLIASGGGVNHLYVHESADLDLAATITLDSKLPEPAGCTSVELVLADRRIAGAYLTALLRQTERTAKERTANGRAAAGVPAAPDGEPPLLTVRLDPAVPGPEPASPGRPWRIEALEPHDLGREFLDPTIGVLAVDGLSEAAGHIRRYGSTHTEGVIAQDAAVAEEFARRVDAATVVVNGSLRLHDGPKLGIGAELAIATGRLHVRGPVTLGSLLTRTWVVEGNGQLRG
ncbi:glutamate-5-semialdehyde dehydrogenase [Streptomyces apocyni]|uniref:glutamate-5-semialdehyde dehydrogenase n=1 Tax=Streptomyces apocyni TaxID=2654677 RepID=UPI0012EAA4E3|nr:glutamate-5-semialdehyde dehydrogenase [Streptomyces apocyni]